MDFNRQRAELCLQSLDLVTLFQVLGWTPPSKGEAIATKVLNRLYRVHCIAQREGARIWEIKLNTPTDLTVKLKARLYQAIHKKHPQPLLIFTDRHRDRSLWYWQSNHHRGQSLVFVAHQPLMGWHCRLDYLAAYTAASGPLTLRPKPIHCEQLIHQLGHQLNHFCNSITGISDGSDRRWYAAVLLQRLMLVYGLQQRRLLNNDVWYLHNHLGRSQQQQPDSFFQRVLQPLFTQGFSLPAVERPPGVNWIGQIPYLGDMFYIHPLERRYGTINIADAPFESLLLWFESPLWQRVSNCWQASSLGVAFEHLLTKGEGEPLAQITEDHDNSCELVLSQFVLRHLDIVPDESGPDLWDLLFWGKTHHLRQLVQTVLPQLSVLDPACGIGTLLVTVQHRLVDIYSVLIAQLDHSPGSQLEIWLRAIRNENSSLLQTIYRRIFKYGLYGVDITPAVVDCARLYLLLGMVAIARTTADIEPLPNLDFNIVTGNSLVGFIRVDEAGFDRLRSSETLLQGNLLQPLAAESYRTILSEKNIALEHYRTRSYVLEELQQAIPQYAQLEFFREQINHLDAQAQAKLNELLLAEFSQTLGIRFKQARLLKAPQQRLLSLEDIVVLQPFHWGYHFNHVLEQTKGFQVIISAPPQGIFRPTAQEFLQQFYDLRKRKKLDVQTFKTTKRSLVSADPDVTRSWLTYQSQYSLVTDYFYRSPQYDHQSPLLKGKRQRTQLRRHWLFIERCFNLLAPGGVCGLIISNDIKESPRGVALRSLLDTQTVGDLQSHSPDSLKTTGEQGLLWFCKMAPSSHQ